MSTQISLDRLPQVGRFERFREISSSLFVPVSLKCDDPMTFQFVRTEKTFGSLSIGMGQISKLDVTRTDQDVMRSESDTKIKVTLLLSGSASIQQDKREALVKPGQFYVNDPARPYEEHIPDGMRYISVHIPKRSIHSRLNIVDLSTGFRFGSDLPNSKLATDFLTSLSTVWPTIDEGSNSHLASIFLDLIMAAMLERSDRIVSNPDIYRSAQYHRAKSLIDGRLHDPELSFTQIAAELGVTTRYISYLLQERGLSYRRYVLEQRLVRAANDLSDPRLAQRTVTEIAYSWGFSDGAHFSRAFKASRAMSPREYRASKLSR